MHMLECIVTEAVSQVQELLRPVYKDRCSYLLKEWEDCLDPEEGLVEFGRSEPCSSFKFHINLELSYQGETKVCDQYWKMFSDKLPGAGAKEPRRTILCGPAGSGKTTIGLKIAHDFCVDPEDADVAEADKEGARWLQERFRFLIHLNLADVERYDTLIKALGRQLADRSLDESFGAMLQWPDVQEKMLVILDSYDEFRHKDTCRDINDIAMGRRFARATVLVITRRHMLTSLEPDVRKQRVVSTLGLKRDEMLKVARRHSSLERILSSAYSERVTGVLRNPLMFFMAANVPLSLKSAGDGLEVFDVTKNVVNHLINRFVIKSQSEEHSQAVTTTGLEFLGGWDYRV